MITKFKIFENVDDLDPYGEEEWEEPVFFKDGDKIICINDDHARNLNIRYRLEKGRVYTVNHFKEPTIMFKSGFVSLKEMDHDYPYKANRFKKVVNESVQEIDPYGEENWNDVPKKEETKYWYRGQFLPRSEIIDIIRDSAIDFFERHPFRTDYYISGIMFHKIEFLNESVQEIDPYGEENDWFEKIELDTNINVDDELYDWTGRFVGNITRIEPNEDLKYIKYIVGNKQIDKAGLVNHNFRINKKIENKDIDPYGEEKWEEDMDDPANWNDGDVIICTNKEGGGGKRLVIGKEYTIFDITKPTGHSVWVKGDNTYYSTRYFKLKR